MSEKDTLTFSELAQVSKERAALWHNGTEPPMIFREIEVLGEFGEVCNAVKKLARAVLGMVGGTTNKTNLGEELADVVICTDLIATQAGIDLGAAVVDKFNATSEKHGFPHRLTAAHTATQAAEERLALALEALKECDNFFKWKNYDKASPMRSMILNALKEPVKCSPASSAVSSAGSGASSTGTSTGPSSPQESLSPRADAGTSTPPTTIPSGHSSTAATRPSEQGTCSIVNPAAAAEACPSDRAVEVLVEALELIASYGPPSTVHRSNWDAGDRCGVIAREALAPHRSAPAKDARGGKGGEIK